MRKMQMIVICLLIALIVVSCGIASSTKSPKNEGIILPQGFSEKDAALPETEEELDQLFEELAASGQKTNAVLDRLKQEKREFLVDYLMLTFLNGGLEGCDYDDGSVGTLQYATWCSFRGNEILESPAVSPAYDWEEWSSYAAMLYERNGYDFLVEYGYPMAARYAKLAESMKEAPVLSTDN